MIFIIVQSIRFHCAKNPHFAFCTVMKKWKNIITVSQKILFTECSRKNFTETVKFVADRSLNPARLSYCCYVFPSVHVYH